MKNLNKIILVSLAAISANLQAESPSFQETLNWINVNLREKNPSLISSARESNYSSTTHLNKDFRLDLNAAGELCITSNYYFFHFHDNPERDRTNSNPEKSPHPNWRGYDPANVLVCMASETNVSLYTGGKGQTPVLAYHQNGTNYFLFPLPADTSMHPRFATAFRNLLKQGKSLPREPF